MKLNGNSHGSHSAGGGGRRSDRGVSRDTSEMRAVRPEAAEAARAAAKPAPGRRRKRSAGRVIGAVFGALVCLCVLAVVVYSMWEKPPERPGSGLIDPVGESVPPAESADPSSTPAPTPTPDPNAGAPASLNENMYTFLVVGFDKVAYHTDTIMLGSIDTEEHTIDVFSIPRDTLMNISGGTKKINELYLRGINTDGNGMGRLLQGIRDILGFDVDVYAAVDLEAFVELINAMGGVDYDVPQDMYYYDLAQDLIIELDAGPQHLTGEQAIGVVRYRSGYVTADIGRIETQQDFLKSIADQFLSLGNIPRLGEFIDIFTKYVETNMDASNLAFFARQFLMCKSEDVVFHGTIPANTNDAIKGLSYCSINISEWLEVINEYLNPYDKPVTEANVNILTHSFTSGFYSTTGTIAGGIDSFTDFTSLR